MKVKILTIMGTRPEAIKLAPVVREMARRSDRFCSRVCLTAQHREMLDQALAPFDIHADHDLDLMTPGQTLARTTSLAIERLDNVIAAERPDVVLVQGDTTSAFCGALAAYYQRTRVGHVEAGLRTGNKFAPYPEEINRRLIGQLTDYHFAPTEEARRALLREGFAEEGIFVTRNTVIDALLWMREVVRRNPPKGSAEIEPCLRHRTVVLMTAHRRESFGAGFESICRAVRRVADAFPDVLFVYPVHRNPNVVGPVERILGGHPRILLLEPVPYELFVWLMDRATIVLTDSGGVQEEAPSLGKPVLVMRETTERPEGIEAGNAVLVGTREETITGGLTDLLRNPARREAMSKVINPYGDGKASGRIADVLESIPKQN